MVQREALQYSNGMIVGTAMASPCTGQHCWRCLMVQGGVLQYTDIKDVVVHGFFMRHHILIK